MGGIERLLIDMSRSMVRKGHTVYLCIINEDYTPSLLDEVDPGVQVVLLHRKPGASLLQASLRFARFAAAHPIDVLHCQGLNCVLFSAPAILARPRMAVLNTVHDKGDYTSYYPRRTIFLAERLLDHTVAISDSVREEILSVSPHPEKVTTIYNAIDTDKFCLRNAGSPASASLSDRGADWKKQPFVIGNVARFLPEKKGQDLLVRPSKSSCPNFRRFPAALQETLPRGSRRPMMNCRPTSGSIICRTTSASAETSMTFQPSCTLWMHSLCHPAMKALALH